MTDDDNDNKNTIVIQNNNKNCYVHACMHAHTQLTKPKSIQKTFLPVGVCALCFQQEEISDAYICPNPKCCSAWKHNQFRDKPHADLVLRDKQTTWSEPVS